MGRFLCAVLAVSALSCGGEPSTPSRPEVAGTYTLTLLLFDPQGVLTQVDIRARLDGTPPRLVLAPAGEAQLVFEDPATGLITTVDGRYTTPQGGVRMDFGEGDTFRSVLLSRRMTFSSSASTLTFDGDAPDGVARQRLVQLVPEWSGEQMLDPVPGRLTVTFARAP